MIFGINGRIVTQQSDFFVEKSFMQRQGKRAKRAKSKISLSSQRTATEIFANSIHDIICVYFQRKWHIKLWTFVGIDNKNECLKFVIQDKSFATWLVRLTAKPTVSKIYSHRTPMNMLEDYFLWRFARRFGATLSFAHKRVTKRPQK